MCGLVAARELSETGRDVIVLEKSRGVGGRMATRRIGDAVIDHGAQFVTWHDPEFEKLVREWTTGGVAREWARGLSFPHGVNGTGSPAFRGESGMTSIAKSLADRADVRISTTVTGVSRGKLGYVVHTDGGDLSQASVLLFTAPVPQSLAVLANGDVKVPAESRRTLSSITYDPCLTVLAVLDGPSRIPTPGALRLAGEPIAFLADNRQKGISPDQFSVTIQAGTRWSRERFEDDTDVIAADLLKAASEHIGAGVVSHQVMRWQYGVPVLVQPEPWHRVGTEAIFFAGDAFGGPNVEGAARSGRAVAHEIRHAT